MSANRVAVIAIHGVGDHVPFEMARAVGDMLEELEDGMLRPKYCSFGEDWVRLNVAPVKVQGHVFPAADSRSRSIETRRRGWGPLDALFASKHRVQSAANSATDSLDHLFMEGQLAEYRGEGPEETYEVLRLKGRRYANAPIGAEGPNGNAPMTEKEVHVYDMFWSDLSTLGKGGFRIFGELYQLLFHLGSIGVNNVKAAAITLRETDAAKAWAGFDAVQVKAAAMLALPIPVLNLIMLAFTAAVVAVACLSKLSAAEELITTSVVLFAVIAGACGYGLIRNRRFSRAAFRWPVVLFLLASSAVSILATVTSFTLSKEPIEVVAGLMVLTGALTGVWFVIKVYEKRRPGAKRAFVLCLLCVAGLALCFALLLFPQSPDYFALSILLRFIELTFWALFIAWGLFWLAFAAAFFAGYWAVKRTGARAGDDRPARTNWTARLTLALPATFFLLLTFAGWMGILSVSLRLLPNGSQYVCSANSGGTLRSSRASSVLCYSALFPPGEPSSTAHYWAWHTMLQAGVGYAPPFLLLVCFAAIICVWGLTPSVLDEVSPPRGAASKLAEEAASLGDWLDNGYGFMRWAGRLIYVGVFAFPLGMALPFLHWHFLDGYKNASIPFMESVGAIVAGAGIGILGLGGRLSKLAMGFRPIVRVALDVDNWMREHPLDSNPTARICGRYVSLLRYVAQWKNESGLGYDTLIIFAHSQGTVVTADLLRFLEVEARNQGNYQAYDHTLARLDEITRHLFTVGCPLRQLYGLRFPYLYGYAPTGSQDDLPDPQDLGVRGWVNAYRTGDYVGRYLWGPHSSGPLPWNPAGQISFGTWDPPQNVPQNVWVKNGRIEFSIGPGAHTHYWDTTAEPIAETLDALIARS